MITLKELLELDVKDIDPEKVYNHTLCINDQNKGWIYGSELIKWKKMKEHIDELQIKMWYAEK